MEKIRDPISAWARQPIIPAMAQESPLTRRLMDIDLAQRVSRALEATGQLKLCEIEVAVCEQVVTLMGQVPNSYLKLAAQTTILNVPGFEQIINQLEVIKEKTCPSNPANSMDALPSAKGCGIMSETV